MKWSGFVLLTSLTIVLSLDITQGLQEDEGNSTTSSPPSQPTAAEDIRAYQVNVTASIVVFALLSVAFLACCFCFMIRPAKNDVTKIPGATSAAPEAQETVNNSKPEEIVVDEVAVKTQLNPVASGGSGNITIPSSQEPKGEIISDSSSGASINTA